MSPAVASRTLSAPGPLLARTLRTPPAAPGLGAPGSSLLGVSSLSVPYPARKWDSNNREGHLQVTYSSFLPSYTWRRHAPARLHSFFFPVPRFRRYYQIQGLAPCRTPVRGLYFSGGGRRRVSREGERLGSPGF